MQEVKEEEEDGEMVRAFLRSHSLIGRLSIFTPRASRSAELHSLCVDSSQGFSLFD